MEPGAEPVPDLLFSVFEVQVPENEPPAAEAAG